MFYTDASRKPLTVDFSTTTQQGVQHSGDVMSASGGHHSMDVSLDQIPADVTRLFFILSAYNAPNIKAFRSPSVELKDVSTGKELCETFRINDAGNHQAVVMCAMSRPSGEWQVEQVSKTSAGNAKNYNPISTTCRALIGQMSL